MKRIPLTQNQFALVDDVDFEELSKHKWYASKLHYGGFVAKRHKKGKVLLMSRVIMDAPKDKQVDHRNHDTLLNCRYNLRLCTNAQNHYNQRSRGGASKYKGVYFYKPTRKWQGQIKCNYKKQHLGYFDTEIEAAKAYDAKAIELFGEFARLNFGDLEQ